jgi:hypothetical protein
MTQPGPAQCSRCGTRLAYDNSAGRCGPCQAADRHRVAHAPDVPAEFWQHPALQQAFTQRHMGRVVRAYRRHPYHGRHPLAQEVVAGWVRLGQTQLSRIESGPAMVHLDRLIQWARALRIPAEYLWFKLPDDGSNGTESEDMKRRTFLAGAGAAVAGAVVPAYASDSVHPTTPARALAPSSSDLAAVMFAHDSEPNEPAPVARLRTQVLTAWQLRQRASYEALAQLLPGLVRQAETSAAALAGRDQEQASRVVVHSYNATSSLLKTLGDAPLALLAADRAVRTARSLDDPPLLAAALYRLANVLLTAHRLDDTKTVALSGAALIEPGKAQTQRSLATWGGLLLTAAVASARNGDESDAWELMGEARTASRLLGTDHADLYTIFGPTNVAIHGVQVAVELHNGRDAVRRSRQVDPDRLPVSLVERRSQFLIDVAHGHALDNDPAAAVATLLRADKIAPEQVRLSPDAQTLTRTLLSQHRIGAASDLRDLAARIGVADQPRRVRA